MIKKFILRKSLPQMGEWFKLYFDKKESAVFPKPMTEKFIKEGQIDDNTWLLRKTHEFPGQNIVIHYSLKITVVERQS